MSYPIYNYIRKMTWFIPWSLFTLYYFQRLSFFSKQGTLTRILDFGLWHLVLQYKDPNGNSYNFYINI
jgi:hypothetical protein